MSYDATGSAEVGRERPGWDSFSPTGRDRRGLLLPVGLAKTESISSSLFSGITWA